MRTRSKHIKLFFTLNVLLPIILGGIIYLSFRKDSLLMFHWFDIIGLSFVVEFLRSIFYQSKIYLPNWFLYSLPDGLWLYSSVFFFSYLWQNEKKNYFIFWCLICPLLAIGSELGQLFNIIQGSFSNLDLLFYFFGTCLAFIITKQKGRLNYETQQYIT